VSPSLSGRGRLGHDHPPSSRRRSIPTFGKAISKTLRERWLRRSLCLISFRPPHEDLQCPIHRGSSEIAEEGVTSFGEFQRASEGMSTSRPWLSGSAFRSLSCTTCCELLEGTPPREERREKEETRGSWPRSEEMIVRLMVHRPELIP